MLKRFSHQTISYAITLLFVILALFSIWQLWHYYMQAPWTRDGRVRAQIVRVPSELSAPIIAVYIADNQFVKKGDLLFELDATNYKLALTQAEAYLKTRHTITENSHYRYDLLTKQAAIIQRATKIDKPNSDKLNNLKDLYASDITADTDMDTLNKSMPQLKLDLENAIALEHEASLKVDRAQQQLTKTKIYAPVNGYVTHLNKFVGSFAQQQQPVVTLINADSFYINGYFLETQLSNVKIGDLVTIKLLGQEQYPMQGKVTSIARGIDDDNANESTEGLNHVSPSFNWVRMAQRIPVHIEITQRPKQINLIVGLSCTVKVIGS